MSRYWVHLLFCVDRLTKDTFWLTVRQADSLTLNEKTTFLTHRYSMCTAPNYVRPNPPLEIFICRIYFKEFARIWRHGAAHQFFGGTNEKPRPSKRPPRIHLGIIPYFVLFEQCQYWLSVINWLICPLLAGGLAMIARPTDHWWYVKIWKLKTFGFSSLFKWKIVS